MDSHHNIPICSNNSRKRGRGGRRKRGGEKRGGEVGEGEGGEERDRGEVMGDKLSYATKGIICGGGVRGRVGRERGGKGGVRGGEGKLGSGVGELGNRVEGGLVRRGGGRDRGRRGRRGRRR